jgi:hypothetical protein
MSTKAAALPKNIAALTKREAELQASVDKWSQAAFRAERDRLTAVVHSGSATDEEIALHADFRDGGKINEDFSAMEASCSAALDSFRRANWQEYRAFLLTRLQCRRDREVSIQNDIEVLRSGYGIQVDYSDPEAVVTSQLALLVEREDSGWIRFGAAAEIF